MTVLKGDDWYVALRWVPRDLWVGVFVKNRDHIYVCPLPTVVFEFYRLRRA